MESDDIIPDSLDEAPSAKVTVIYPGEKEVDLGKELTPTDVIEEPKVSWDADPKKLYTLSMIDPDAPSRENPIYREINHWLVVNIKGNDLTTGETITPYRGSRAPKGTGLHRYIFIVFEQSGQIAVNEQDLKTERRNFNLRKFAKKYGLGKAYAGNYYKAQWDSSVPELKS
ncbi:protein D3-like [Cylas formicarius]|uniref:protein D3-like n=1 Tax=Cylas formicarius TaxID=197179 RepID=UPI002958ACBF|nr:protein D3-like [Cylas formicarius]XP_060517234.1 protein D3-like [Cylas formicarius]XP_060517235.1 protein D3-like [Cylas formicarius]